MHTIGRHWTRVAPLAVLLALAASPAASAAAAQQSNDGAVPDKTAEAIREHIDQAEDIVERLLDWRHALATVRTNPREAVPPTEPATTLISVDREDVQELSALLDAMAALQPKAQTQAAAAPRGDLRAHVQKAQEIARELIPSSATTPVGTSGRTGGTGDQIEVDRAALERLEIEIDAMEMVAPRRLN